MRMSWFRPLGLLVLACVTSCLGEGDPYAKRLLLFAGQSNAGRGGSDSTLESRMLAATAWQFSGEGKAGSGWELQPQELLTELEPVSDSEPGGHFVATLTAFALAGGGDDRDYIVRTDWMGGQPLNSFLDGSINFKNTQTALRAVRDLAAPERVHNPWYVWIHGESGPYDRHRYAELLRTYIHDIGETVKTELGQSRPPVFLMVQTNTGDWLAATQGDASVAMAQWDVARETPGVVMAGPMYHIPMVVDANDNIHSSSLGRMVLGDMLAAVISHGRDWRPLQPLRASLRGRTILVTYDVPGSQLEWDDQWVPNTPNFGFGYRDSENSAEITSVRIVGADTVRIELNRVPTGTSKMLTYGVGSTDGTLDGWAEERGQLMSPTRRESYFWNLGYAVPRFVNHYSIRFSLALED